jgi:hypothetical protein
MLSIRPDALALIRRRNRPVYLDLPPVVQGGCCLPSLQECPVIRFSPPRDAARQQYEVQEIQGVTVHVPRRMPRDGNFTLKVSSFLGLKRVVLEGWRLL